MTKSGVYSFVDNFFSNNLELSNICVNTHTHTHTHTPPNTHPPTCFFKCCKSNIFSLPVTIVTRYEKNFIHFIHIYLFYPLYRFLLSAFCLLPSAFCERMRWAYAIRPYLANYDFNLNSPAL